MLPDVPEYILQHVTMPYLHLHPCGPCFVSSPALTIVPPVPCPALRDRAGNIIRERAGLAAVPPVRDECNRALLPSLPGFYRLPDRLPPRSPTLLQTVRRRQHEPRLRSLTQFGDQPVRLRPTFRSLRAGLRRPFHDDASAPAFPRLHLG